MYQLATRTSQRRSATAEGCFRFDVERLIEYSTYHLPRLMSVEKSRIPCSTQAEAERTLELWPEFERIFGTKHLAATDIKDQTASVVSARGGGTESKFF
jgi:hypothetical protein